MADSVTSVLTVDRSPSATERSGIAPWAAIFVALAAGWAIWACAEYWRGNPNYSYGWAVPFLVLGFAIRRYLIIPSDQATPETRGIPSAAPLALIATCAVFALEFCREQVWHPIIVVWAISLFAVASIVVLLGLCGGWRLAQTELFPVFFFLAAVPWPPRIEQPITSELMRWVAAATTELLHWFGIEAQAAGGAIALRNGLVGITEACSGIRSLQAGLMFGLAMGEWFLLPRARRFALVAIAVLLAIGTNLARTLALTIQAHNHGIAGVDDVHDLVGNIIITALVLAIWLAGKLLAPRDRPTASPDIGRLRSLGSSALQTSLRGLPLVTASLVVGLAAARVLTGRIEAHDQTQTLPFFTAKIDDQANAPGQMPRDVWKELGPSSGEYVRRHDPALPGEVADCFHFFWKPSPWNRFVLVHRPDICMPGVGWQVNGPPGVLDTELNGQPVRFYVFRFRRGELHALELWGAWRNGDPVPLDYTADQVLGVTAAPSNLRFNGKRRSATEIVSCGLVANGEDPPVETAVATLRNVFQYHRR